MLVPEGCPLNRWQIVELPIDEFNELLEKSNFSEEQKAKFRDLRRKGKNRVSQFFKLKVFTKHDYYCGCSKTAYRVIRHFNCHGLSHVSRVSNVLLNESLFRKVAAKKSREKRISGIEHLKQMLEKKERNLTDLRNNIVLYEKWNANLQRGLEMASKSKQKLNLM